MKISILHGHVIDPTQAIDQVIDLAIENGKIAYLGNIPADFLADQIIDATDQWIVPGLIDLCCRPQLQHPQGPILYQEAKTALQCGFTGLCLPPDGDPIVDNVINVARIVQQPDPSLPTLYPIGALTTKLAGHGMTDLTTLSAAGCIAFSQAQSNIDNLRILRHCYDYAASFSLPIIIQPHDPILAKGGVAHEGNVASHLGLPGIPEIAETIAIAQHLLLIEKTGIRAHFTCLSSERSVAQIKEAKTRGLPVTADVAMHSLHLTENDIRTFDANCHVYPPLRTEKDRLGLIEGLQSGTIDAICSDHRPLDSTAKLAPFGDTLPGLSALDSFVSLGIELINTHLMTRLAFIQHASSRPACIFGLSGGSLAIGAKADLCAIHPKLEWEVNNKTLKSKGKNSPFKDRTLRGKVTLSILNGTVAYHEN